jgi:ferric-dicitrate binding protein FerR (iron transport regulator)
MSAQETQPTASTNDRAVSRKRRRWWLIGAGLVVLLVAGMVVLELWEDPPSQLHAIRQMVVDAVHWMRVN